MPSTIPKNHNQMHKKENSNVLSLCYHFVIGLWMFVYPPRSTCILIRWELPATTFMHNIPTVLPHQNRYCLLSFFFALYLKSNKLFRFSCENHKRILLINCFIVHRCERDNFQKGDKITNKSFTNKIVSSLPGDFHAILWNRIWKIVIIDYSFSWCELFLWFFH